MPLDTTTTVGIFVAEFKYTDVKTGYVLRQYLTHRFAETAEYITDGAWKKLLEKTRVKLRGQVITAEPRLDFIDDILNRTKLQTDDVLCEEWSCLLASVLQGSDCVRRDYFDILERMSSYDVLVMNAVMSTGYTDFTERLCAGDSEYVSGSAEFKQVFYTFFETRFALADEEEIGLSAHILEKMSVFKSEAHGMAFQLTKMGKGLRKALGKE